MDFCSEGGGFIRGIIIFARRVSWNNSVLRSVGFVFRVNRCSSRAGARQFVFPGTTKSFIIISRKQYTLCVVVSNRSGTFCDVDVKLDVECLVLLEG